MSLVAEPTTGPGRRRPLSARLSEHWEQELTPARRQAVLSWAAFAGTFGGVRALTHWIKDGHGPSSGGISLGGTHFHHYNLGIMGLAGIAASLIYGRDGRHRDPRVAIGYGVSSALVVDEAALLWDLQDVYWAKQGRDSVDLAVGIISLGALALAGQGFWRAALKELGKR